MDDEQRYLFDLQGWVTIPEALDRDQLATLNAAFDERIVIRRTLETYEEVLDGPRAVEATI